MIYKSLSTVLFVILISACGSNEAHSGRDESETATDRAGSGLSTVTLDQVTYELETWPNGCGETRDRKGFVIKAGPNDGDADPGNNLLTLTITGDRYVQPFTSIRYTPPGERSETEDAKIEGDNPPWIEGKRFRWSGQTRSGVEMTIEAECP